MLREHDLLGPLEGVSGLVIGVDKGVDLIANLARRGDTRITDRLSDSERAGNLESAGDITKRSYLATFRAGQKIRVQVNFDNTGQTPAYAMCFEVDTKVLPLPLPKNFDFATSVTTEQAITGPHSTLFTTVTSENEISSKESDDVENTRSAVYVYGRVGYEDAFNRKHWNEF